MTLTEILEYMTKKQMTIWTVKYARKHKIPIAQALEVLDLFAFCVIRVLPLLEDQPSGNKAYGKTQKLKDVKAKSKGLWNENDAN